MTVKLFLNLGSSPENESALRVDPLPATADDPGRLRHALQQGICPDCLKRAMNTTRITSRVTFHRCRECGAGFDLDWSSVCIVGDTRGLQITRLLLCPACEGLGRSWTKFPDGAPKLQTCLQCNGRGFIQKV